MKVLVIAPHPDDEVLGVGGTIASYAANGADVIVAIVTKGQPDLFDQALVEQTRDEARTAHRILGVRETRFLDFPAARLDVLEHYRLNEAIKRTVDEIKPETVFIPFNGDLHKDHREVFISALVALRPPSAPSVSEIFCYETLSETYWGAPGLEPDFVPDMFFDITDHLETKLTAMKAYGSQLRQFPNERSLEGLTCLARLRGANVCREAAEAFRSIRQIRSSRRQ